MKRIINNAFALILNFLIIVGAVYATGGMITKYYSLNGTLSYYVFRYLNVTTAIFLALTSCVMVIMEFRNLLDTNATALSWCLSLRLLGVTASVMTLIFALCIIAPKEGFSRTFSGYRLTLNLICPLLGIYNFLFFENTNYIDFKTTWFSVIFNGLYSLVYLIMVVWVKKWPDYYSLFRGSNLIPIGVFVIMTALTLGVCVGLYFLYCFLNRKIKEFPLS